MGQVDSGTAEYRYPRSLVRAGQQIVSDPAGVQHLQRARHGGERATGRVDGRPALQYCDRPAGAREITGGGQAGRACADHQNIDVMDRHHATASGLGYHRRMSSGVDMGAR